MSTNMRWRCRLAAALDHRAQRAGRPAATPDHVAVVIRTDGQLKHHGPVVLVHLADLHLIGVVDQPSSQILEKLSWCGRVLAHRRGGSALRDVLRAQELANGVGGLGTAGQPVLDPLLVEDNGGGIGLRVVVPDGFNHPSVALGALVGHDHPPDRVLAAADAGQSESHCHTGNESSGFAA